MPRTAAQQSPSPAKGKGPAKKTIVNALQIMGFGNSPLRVTSYFSNNIFLVAEKSLAVMR